MKKYLKQFGSWLFDRLDDNKEILTLFLMLQFAEIKNEGLLLAIAFLIFWGANKVIFELRKNNK
jgi:hypothetical protein